MRRATLLATALLAVGCVAIIGVRVGGHRMRGGGPTERRLPPETASRADATSPHGSGTGARDATSVRGGERSPIATRRLPDAGPSRPVLAATARDTAYFGARLAEFDRIEDEALRAVAASDAEFEQLRALVRQAQARRTAAAEAVASAVHDSDTEEAVPIADTAEIDAQVQAILGDRYAAYVQRKTALMSDALEAAMWK
jgi:hypothetical protein